MLTFCHEFDVDSVLNNCINSSYLSLFLRIPQIILSKNFNNYRESIFNRLNWINFSWYGCSMELIYRTTIIFEIFNLICLLKNFKLFCLLENFKLFCLMENFDLFCLLEKFDFCCLLSAFKKFKFTRLLSVFCDSLWVFENFNFFNVLFLSSDNLEQL